MRSTFVALLVLVAAGCGCEHCGKDAGGSDVVARLDDRHTLTAPITVGNLTVWPVLTDKPLDLGEFLTLEEALAKGAAEIREVGTAEGAAEAVQVEEDAPSAEEPPQRVPVAAQEAAQTLGEEAQTLVLDGAVVNTLVIENKGDVPILVCAGTVVKGGNQDRQIAEDFVLKAKSTTPVDAFCVEQGRWQSDRLGEDTGGKFQVLEGMATAKVRAKGQYEKDQAGVWQEVAETRAAAQDYVASSGVATNAPIGLSAVPFRGPRTNSAIGLSSSYAVAADAAGSAEEIKGREETLAKHFAAHAGAVGFAYAINGRPVAVRTFAHPRLLGKHLGDFLRGMATEAVLTKADGPAGEASAQDMVALVRKISASAEQVEETAGLNRNGKRLNEAGYNGTCYVADGEGRLAPLTQDWTAK